MAHTTGTGRSKFALVPGEQILACDVVGEIREHRRGPQLPVVTVTDLAVYLVIPEGRDVVRRIDFTDVTAVGRKTTMVGRELQLIVREGQVFSSTTVVYLQFGGDSATADQITERFFGRVVQDTTVEFPTDSA